jgi:hypothetical protein
MEKTMNRDVADALPHMSDREAHELWQGLMETFALPEGVHYLSYESQDILRRVAERSAALEARYVNKRGS